MNEEKLPSKLHAFLSRHKIIFETVAVAAFTLASVFVAVLQWHTAEKQAIISMRQSQPNFVISSRQIWNEKLAFFTDDELIIQNFGGPPRALHHQITTFVRITTLTKADPKPRQADIPLIGYYSSSIITSDAVTGLLIKGTGFHNDQKMARLVTDLRGIAEKEGAICYADVRRYVKLSYADIFDKSHEEYFAVAPVTGASRVPPNEGSKWVDRFFEDFSENGGVDLDKVTAHELWDAINRPSTAK